MFAKVNSVGLFGMKAFMVEVEIDLSQGLPRFDLVGLPDSSVAESKDRVRSAIKNCGYEFPISRITANLAPADYRKEGPIYDLPILMAILLASRQIIFKPFEKAFLGEVSLSGEVRRINGVLSMVMEAKRRKIKEIFLPFENVKEASIVEGITIYPVKHVNNLIDHFLGKTKIEEATHYKFSPDKQSLALLDFSEVKGQNEAKRALEIAAAGGHNVIMIGPPGSGKSMLAKRIPSILPDMTFEEAIETTEIYSIAEALTEETPIIRTRPFRYPHHTISSAGLAGGGTVPKPGELSLSHNGVLFLDELPEFSRNAMETMRQPMEDNEVTISRVIGSFKYPCSIMLVCAMNPCPCGFFGHPSKVCTCPKGAPAKYLSKVSGPLVDRIDIHIEVGPINYEELGNKSKGESSTEIKDRVNKARKIQSERYNNKTFSCNAKIDTSTLREVCALSEGAEKILHLAFDKLALSARAHDKILKISRTIADLEQEEQILSSHVTEAIHYRSLDRKFWKN